LPIALVNWFDRNLLRLIMDILYVAHSAVGRPGAVRSWRACGGPFTGGSLKASNQEGERILARRLTYASMTLAQGFVWRYSGRNH
jgi:hypothetical protein